jgi:hypothetical protein
VSPRGELKETSQNLSEFVGIRTQKKERRARENEERVLKRIQEATSAKVTLSIQVTFT